MPAENEFVENSNLVTQNTCSEYTVAVFEFDTQKNEKLNKF